MGYSTTECPDYLEATNWLLNKNYTKNFTLQLFFKIGEIFLIHSIQSNEKHNFNSRAITTISARKTTKQDFSKKKNILAILILYAAVTSRKKKIRNISQFAI